MQVAVLNHADLCGRVPSKRWWV